MRHRTLSSAILALLLIPALSFAQATKPEQKPHAPGAKPAAPAGSEQRESPFDEMDTNHDGVVTREEFMAFRDKRFKELDTNHDGKVTPEEVAHAPELMQRNMRIANRMVQSMDPNHLGYVTQKEWDAQSEKRFKAMDKDGTGKVKKPEERAPKMRGRQPGKPLQPIPPNKPLQPVPPPTPGGH
ncbi:MAG: EF-hand domain-containing protein [Lysobacterales bacterium]